MGIQSGIVEKYQKQIVSLWQRQIKQTIKRRKKNKQIIQKGQQKQLKSNKLTFGLGQTIVDWAKNQKNQKNKVNNQLSSKLIDSNKPLKQYIIFKPTQMIIEQNQLSHPKMNQLMFNIQTKLSLLSQIQRSVIENGSKYRHDAQLSEENRYNDRIGEEINLPMQMLDRKMQQIINEKSPMSEKRANYKDIRTFEKKRLQLNQLQTATRNIDEIKRNPMNDHSSNPHNLQYKLPQQQVRQFTHQTQPSISSSMLQSGSKSKSSKILTKFNQIQLSYIQKIKSLSFKLSFMEQKLSQAQEENNSLMESLQTYKLLYSRKQEQVQREIEKRLEEVKDKLIEKFAEECRLKYNQYITELKEGTAQLNEERKKRKFFEEQNKVFRLEKQNYQQMYKNLAKKQKQWLKLDIDHTKNQLFANHSHIDLSAKQTSIQQGSSYLMIDKKPYHQNELHQVEEYSQIHGLTNQDETQMIDKENVIHNTKDHYHGNRETQKARTKFSIQKSNKSMSRSKEKSLSKSKDNSTSNNKKQPQSQKKKNSKSRTQADNETLKQSGVKRSTKHKAKDSAGQMTKEELIPFLAKGIQQLKQRLKMK